METMMRDAGTHLPLSTRQIAVSVAYGATLWLGVALLLRALAPGIYTGTTRPLVYLLVIPGTLPAVLILERLAALRRDQVALAMAVGTTTAMLLDGTALAWFPQLYGPGVADHAGAGAAILWGAGIGQLLAFWRNRL